MELLIAQYLAEYGPGIVAGVAVALAVWILRAVLAAIARAVWWILRTVVGANVGEIKWHIGWY